MSIEWKPHTDGVPKNEGWKWDAVRRIFGNMRFGQVIHVDFFRDGVAQNDQMLRVELGGGCFIPIDPNGRIGLVRHAVRPQIKNQDEHRKNWPYATTKQLTDSLGIPSWEIPRGYADLGESGTDTARREGSEESGYAVVAAKELGFTCGNTAMEPHFMTVVVGLLDPSKIGLKGDPNEKLLSGLQFFAENQIDDMILSGELYCGTTLSALRLLEAHDLWSVLQTLNRIPQR